MKPFFVVVGFVDGFCRCGFSRRARRRSGRWRNPGKSVFVHFGGAAGGEARGGGGEEAAAWVGAEAFAEVAVGVEDVGEAAGVALDHDEGDVDGGVEFVEFGDELADGDGVGVPHFHGGVARADGEARGVVSAVAGEVEEEVVAGVEGFAGGGEPVGECVVGGGAGEGFEGDGFVAFIDVGVVGEVGDFGGEGIFGIWGGVGGSDVFDDVVGGTAVGEVDVVGDCVEVEVDEEVLEELDVFFEGDLVVVGGGGRRRR